MKDRRFRVYRERTEESNSLPWEKLEWHTATLLTSGTVLVTGGFLDNNGNAVATAELFDLTSQSFTPTKGNRETPRAFQTATLLKDGTVLVTGGTNRGLLASAERYQ